MMNLQEVAVGSKYAVVPTTFTTAAEFISRYGPGKEKKTGPFLVIGAADYMPTMVINMVSDDTIKVRVVAGGEASLELFKAGVLPHLTKDTFKGNEVQGISSLELVLNHEGALVGAKESGQNVQSTKFMDICNQVKDAIPTANHRLSVEWSDFVLMMAEEVIACADKDDYDSKRVAYCIPGNMCAHVNELPLAAIIMTALPSFGVFALKRCIEKELEGYIEPVFWAQVKLYVPKVAEVLQDSGKIGADFLNNLTEAVVAC